MFGRIDNRGLIRQFFILLLILIIACLGIWLWSEVKNPITQIKENSLLFQVLRETQQALQEEPLFLKLFFGGKDRSTLVVEEREIKKEKIIDKHQQMRQAILELIKGPNTDLAPTIPPDTKLRSIYVDKDNVGYIDFSSELVQNHPGGSWAEVITIYSIVNTIIKNFPQIYKVRLLINGEEIETLHGHLDTRRAFSFNELLSYPQSFF